LKEPEGRDDWEKVYIFRIAKMLLSRRHYGENADLLGLLDCDILNSGVDN